LTVASSASGNKIVKGTFSYIKSNQRVDYELQSKVIRIGDDVVADTGSDIEPTETAGTEATNEPIENDLSAFGGSGMRCVRSIVETNDQEYIVKLTVLENELENFAKIQENIPAGYVVSEEDSDGAVVTISDRGIKYVWFEAPQMDRFEVSYRLTSASSASPNITGVFSYVEDNAPKEVNVVKGPIMSQTGDLANTQEESKVSEPESTTSNPINKEVETEPETIAENIVEEVKEEAKTSPKVETAQTIEETVADVKEEVVEVKKAASNIPAPETGVSYRVQIAASHQVVGQSYFAKKHGFTRPVNIENHEGWVKYTTGSHGVYKSARDDRNQIRDAYSFRGPFVTAYNDGVRITVQEALMITKQQWYK
ncbi:MAG: hypothetical protein NWQ53_09195, partial [Flavobacteriales bacterium]|nr:hypothetical protein [Flavobacteriales bacterium]